MVSESFLAHGAAAWTCLESILITYGAFEFTKVVAYSFLGAFTPETHDKTLITTHCTFLYYGSITRSILSKYYERERRENENKNELLVHGNNMDSDAYHCVNCIQLFWSYKLKFGQ